MCIDGGITQRSAINSTFGLENRQKDRKLPRSFGGILFAQLGKKEAAEKAKDSRGRLGSWVGPEASRMKWGAHGGSECQRPAV